MSLPLTEIPLTLPSPQRGEGRVRGISCQRNKCACISNHGLPVQLEIKGEWMPPTRMELVTANVKDLGYSKIKSS
jgi:hypothetical protein